MTRLLPTLAVPLALLLVTAVPARAHLDPGEAAPALDATAFVNTPALTLRGLRGRVVLLAFFSTRCKHCREHARELQALHRRYEARGLTVLGVTRDDVARCRAFAREHGARYAIAVAGAGAQRAYLVQRYPEACLVSAWGEVLWSGYATRLPESTLRSALARARPQPRYGRGQQWIADGIAGGRYAATRRRLAPLVRCRPVDEGCAALRDAHAWIAWYGRERLAQASELQVLGRPYAAWRALDEVARLFPGEPEEATARAARDRLLERAPARAEVAAGRALTAAIARARALPSREAAAIYAGVAALHPGTTAAQRARRKAELLQRKR